MDREQLQSLRLKHGDLVEIEVEHARDRKRFPVYYAGLNPVRGAVSAELNLWYADSFENIGDHLKYERQPLSNLVKCIPLRRAFI